MTLLSRRIWLISRRRIELGTTRERCHPKRCERESPRLKDGTKRQAAFCEKVTKPDFRLCDINDTLDPMESARGSKKYFESRMSKPEYAEAHEVAARRVAQFDAVIQELDACRKRFGWSKAELARRSGIPSTAVRRLFSHQHKNPTLATLIAISDALDAVILVQPNARNERPAPGLKQQKVRSITNPSVFQELVTVRHD